MSPAVPACLFADIAVFINETVRADLLEACPHMDFAEFSFVFKHREIVSDASSCIRHNGNCRARRAKIHIAGTECIYFSSQNPGRPGTNGPRMVYFFVWIAQRRLLKEPYVLHENVEQFPPQFLVDLLGDLYLLPPKGSVVFAGHDLGNAYVRKRWWTFLILKTELVWHPAPCVVPAWQDFLFLYKRDCAFQWTDRVLLGW